MRLLLVDDHELIRFGMRMLLASHPDWEVCGEAGNGSDAVTQTRQTKPDVVVLDLSMPGMTGLDAAKEIHQIAPSAKIILYTMHVVPAAVSVAGADEFVSKSDPPRELVAAIERVAQKLDAAHSGTQAHSGKQTSQQK